MMNKSNNPKECILTVIGKGDILFIVPHFDIKNVRPWAAYRTVYPDWADVDNLAYRFIGDYPCEAHDHPGLIREIAGEIFTWKNSWRHAKLFMIPCAGSFIISDTRDGKNVKNYPVDAPRAGEIMVKCLYNESANQRWAVEEKLGLIVDSMYVPLVTAPSELLMKFEGEGK